MALPQTDLEGAYQFAERVRAADRGARAAAGRRRRDAEGHRLVRGRLAGHRRRRQQGRAGGRRRRRAVRGQAVRQEPHGPRVRLDRVAAERSRRRVRGVAFRAGMGLLDDAIREHLELKRSRGADPDEVERQEREALGRDPAGASSRESAERGFRVAERLAPIPREPSPSRRGRAPSRRRSTPATSASRSTSRRSSRPRPSPSRRRAGRRVRSVARGGARRGARPTSRSPTRARRREEPAEDVLEDTPDFLQETPEHDRLWFEQRPPRDFDWDK